MRRSTKLLIWEVGCIFWVAFAGAMLHFAFELSEYWKPMALIAAVNESTWEHLKMYFWPGLAFALAQFTYSREYHHNYWLGKATALALTPLVIFIGFESYMSYSLAAGIKPSLGAMLGLMFVGIGAGQLASFSILSAQPVSARVTRLAAPGLASLVLMFSLFTFFPPKIFLFENFACYEYTGEYGILADYEPYRIFTRADADGISQQGQGVNYCASPKRFNAAMIN